ncbi:MAG: DEAD/DEAH box helicase [Halarcobacter sp.]
MTFEELNLQDNLIKATKINKYIEVNPIQEKVIPLILEDCDVMAKAQTGSGKTASFVLPILEKLSKIHRNPNQKAKLKVLVLTPTRELALQVANNFVLFSEFLEKKPKIVSIIGGENIGDQLLDIQKGCDIIVATTGRLIDILNKKQIDLTKIEYFVLDEADKMLDLGFEEELETILKVLPLKRQNLLFSATYPSKILNIVSKITKNPIEVSIKDESQIVKTITQRVIRVNKENKSPLLRHLIVKEKWEQILVFMANKRAADNIAQKFRKYGFEAESFHGDLTQEERSYTLKEFKEKKIKVLFSSDIAARGLDIEDISCVVNFDLPRSTADYIHRIGRTGRAGKTGIAISFINFENEEHFKLIEKRCDVKLLEEQVEGFEETGIAPLKQKGNEAVKGKRKSKKDKLREEALKNNK